MATLQLQRTDHVTSALGRYVDSLLQTFEDRRPGLTDAVIVQGEPAALSFFDQIYQQESPRLIDTIKTLEPHLTDDAREKFRAEVDTLVQKVVIPAYVQLAMRHTPKERNDFYLSKEQLHLPERFGFAFAGMLLGYLVILAPFIPIWSKEWVLPFVVAGFLFPNLRRYFALKRYERELNGIVARADRELSRIDIHYLTSGEAMAELEALENGASELTQEDRQTLERLAAEQKEKN